MTEIVIACEDSDVEAIMTALNTAEEEGYTKFPFAVSTHEIKDELS